MSASSSPDFSEVKDLLQETTSSDSEYEEMIEQRAKMRTDIGDGVVLYGEPQLKRNGDGFLVYLTDIQNNEYIIGAYDQRSDEFTLHWTPPEAL